MKLKINLVCLLVLCMLIIEGDLLAPRFTYFMTDYKIIHQISYTYMPQQDRVSERNNCHLLEVTQICYFI